MKKIIFTIALALIAALLLTACGNRQIIDTTWDYSYAVIRCPNGAIIEGPVQAWMDFENSDQIQVKINGIVYLVHSSNIVLMAE